MIRKYIESDIDEILEVWYQASRMAHPFLDADFMGMEKRNIRDVYIPNTSTWVYINEGLILGFISMMGNEVGAIFVRPDYHGKGIGRQLMDFVSDFHDIMEVEVFERNVVGRAFYDRYGFELLEELVHKETNNRLLRLRFKK
ncbi:GNAT family N-acetyltransferase [Ancylomarina euxinus]|uniref:GNAT family N-acetyltransferase n=1 Tax=Ancylomarina euxinus TaxID=2283627 RepID=A0A425Y366_9BACT|nr:GNAT family N-acetyltransferase [Ancylomarina euxinus]MCZ4695007.1 GNAT family N-acetyltransferase [Ancylomarina euxinus]MUP14872.1 GNAT family N-acetyltransferase [Ancylomarina euxinus]RRG22228.1 GNAT family N-acetyltransferase [Ancylomarina euxinus]